MVERVTTGIPGLDELIEGGLPEGSVTLLSGSTGAGKTTFCSQFLWEGFQNGDSCLFITMEEMPAQVREDALEFGWNFEEEAPGEFNTFYIDPATKSDHTTLNVKNAMDQVEPDRVVIDSISVVEAYWEGSKEVRGNIHNLVQALRGRGVTTVITAEAPEKGQMTRSGIVEYVADGVIALGGLRFGESTFRSLQVLKMRKTDIVEDVQGVELTDEGIVVRAPEKF